MFSEKQGIEIIMRKINVGIVGFIVFFEFLSLRAAATRDGLFPIPDSPIQIEQSVQPGIFFDAIGRRAFIAGHQDGTFEAWVIPFKILHDFRIRIIRDGRAYSLDASRLASRIRIRPESVTIRYVHSAFTIDETIFTPIRSPGSLLLLKIDSGENLTLRISFRSDLQPMWPGGLGGQFTYWDNDLHAFVISESRWKRAAMVGSPFGEKGTQTPAHAQPDAPVQFTIHFNPDSLSNTFVPIAIAGSAFGYKQARQAYERLLDSIPDLYEQTKAHFDSLRTQRTGIVSPDPVLNQAFEWAKVALDNGFMCNPDLGCGLVAGFNTSGKSARPGFAWFFGGDAFINGFALQGIGEYNGMRRAYEFLQKYQRKDGKIPHEISQSAGMIPWFKEFPYAYYHADTTPFYLISMGDYLQATGEIAFIRKSWPSLKKAYTYCLDTDADGDGLMDNLKAGLAAVETGKLRTRKTLTDIYLAAVWTHALDRMAVMAQNLGKTRFARKVRSRYAKAKAALNYRFWNPNKKRLNFALLDGGGVIDELTPWPAVAMSFDDVTAERAVPTLAEILSSRVTTDWGVRLLANNSPNYGPLTYNNGAVWPFVSGFAAWGAFRHHQFPAGMGLLQSLANLTLVDSPGSIPELFSGDRFKSLETAVPHQLFSSTAIIMGTLKGLLGISIDVPENKIRFSPHLPFSWDSLKIAPVWVGRHALTIEFHRKKNSKEFSFNWKGEKPLQLDFSPQIGWASRVKSVTLNGSAILFQTVKNSVDVHLFVSANLHHGENKLIINGEPGFGFEVIHRVPSIGDRDSGLKVTEVQTNNDSIRLLLEGRPNVIYRLRLFHPEKIKKMGGSGVQLETNNIIDVRFSRPGGNFVRKTLVFILKS